MTNGGRRSGALAVLFLAAVTVVMHRSALGGWWLYDDPALLVESIEQPIRGTFFDPATYQHLATHTFVPLQLVSYDLDLQLAGPRPYLFYLHQVLAIGIAGVLLFFVLRRYTHDLVAVMTAAAFLTSWAAIYAARTLMIRHYVEGLVLALIALLLWQRRRDLPAAVVYFLALLCKEVYAPLPLLLIAHARSEGESWREIGKRLIAPAIAFGVFMIWRWRMTDIVGTYAAMPSGRDYARLPLALLDHLAGPGEAWARWVWAAAILAACVLAFVRRRAIVLFAIVIAVALPLIPLAGNFEWRYSFAFAAAAIAGIGLAARRDATMALPLLLFLTTAITATPERRYFENLTRHGMAREGQYLWNERASAPALATSAPGWYVDGLVWIRRHELHSEAPHVVQSRYAITSGAVDPANVVALVDGKPVPIAQAGVFGTPEEWRREIALYDPGAPLAVSLAVHHHVAEWNLGPPGGTFIFLTDPDYTPLEIPASGKLRVPAARERQFFRIRRADPATGRWTISPRLPVPFEGETTVWRR